MITDILWIVFLLALGIQLIYILIIFGRASIFFTDKIWPSHPENQEGVTIIVAAHNEKNNLKKLIPALFAQQYSNFDVMVINDRSNDGTKIFLEKMMAVYPRLRTVTVKYIPSHLNAKKYALTLGIKVAKNDILLLTDADCIPHTNKWIALMTAPLRFENKTFSLGYSQYHRHKGILNKWIQFETLWTGLVYMSFALWNAPFMGVGRNMAYRKSFFMEKKAFKDLWHIDCGDDDLFVNKYANGKNTAVVIEPDSITLSVPKTTWKSYFAQKKRHFHAGKYYRPIDKQKIGIYTFSHLLFWMSCLGLLIFSGLAQKWEQFFVIIGIVVVRSLLLTSVLTSARTKLEGNNKVIWALFYDILYLGYFWIIGTIGYQSNKVKWK